MPFEFFAPGIFVLEGDGLRVSGRPSSRRIETSSISSAARGLRGDVDAGILVPDQPVMLVLKHRRDGPWTLSC